MAQYIYTMNRVSKMVPPKREILKDISLSFFPGAKIGVLGLNGAGKSTLLRIMAGVDKDFSGEARAQPGIKIGYLEQEPPLDPTKDVRGNVEDGVREALDALARLDQVFAEYAEPDADFDALAKEQEKLESIIHAWDAHNLNNQLEIAADALNLPAWDADVSLLSGGERRRVALCRLLLSKPDMLLLDEPTNHLDAESVSWLERFLKDFPGTIVAITHDRYFLDNVAEWILELDRGMGIPYQGNYSSWLEQKNARLEQENKQDLQIVELALNKTNLLEYQDRSFLSLSGGEKQRVILARAIAQDPHFMILDEPCNHLDIRYQLEIMEIVKNLGIGILAALHSLEDACRYCDELYVLKQGHVLAHGKPEEILTEDLIEEVYGVKCKIYQNPITQQLGFYYYK